MKLKFIPLVCMAIACGVSSCKKGIDSSDTDQSLNTQKIEASTVTNLNSDLLLKLVNDTRLTGCNCGNSIMPPVATVTWNANLASAAISHSKYMQSVNKLQHESANGSGVGTRVTAAGYTWKAVGENIAQGQSTELQVFNDWIKSEGHCKNIMNANYKEMGAAKSGSFWTQVFATK